MAVLCIAGSGGGAGGNPSSTWSSGGRGSGDSRSAPASGGAGGRDSWAQGGGSSGGGAAISGSRSSQSLNVAAPLLQSPPAATAFLASAANIMMGVGLANRGSTSNSAPDNRYDAYSRGVGGTGGSGGRKY
jgi:hypothetical protein